eukprot:7620905-Pyramimonas_sp.AAC.1
MRMRCPVRRLMASRTLIRCNVRRCVALRTRTLCNLQGVMASGARISCICTCPTRPLGNSEHAIRA